MYSYQDANWNTFLDLPSESVEMWEAGGNGILTLN